MKNKAVEKKGREEKSGETRENVFVCLFALFEQLTDLLYLLMSKPTRNMQNYICFHKVHKHNTLAE